MVTYLNSFPLLLFTLLQYSVFCHSGKIAFSYPLNNITIDGSLSDWPQDIEKYKINFFLGDSSKNNTYFQTGYDLEHRILYIAVSVQDEHHISSNQNNNIFWNFEDKQFLYLDPEHSSTKGSGVLTIGASQNGFTLKKIRPTWDSYNTSFVEAAIHLEVQHKNGKTIYEWAIHLGQSVQEYKSIGLDFLISDYDGADEPIHKAVWSPGGAKEAIPTRLGDLILLPAKKRTAKAKAYVEWKNKIDDKLPKYYRVQSTSKTNLWTIISIDSAGNLDLNLPVGKYNIGPWQNVTNAFSFENKTRINELSTINFSISETRSNFIDTLGLETFNSPRFLIPATGILYDDKFDAKRLDNFVTIFKNYCNVTGLSLAVIKNGEIVFNKYFGLANTINQRPVDSTSVFEIASISKTIFGFAVNSLAEKGMIDLDQPLFEYLPFKQLNADKRAQKITARHILSHQSGLPNWVWGGPFGSENGGKTSLLFNPGTKYQYSGEAYEYLKRVIEKIIGKDIQTIIAEEVFIPFGMKESSFIASSKIKDRIVVGHTEYIPMFWSLHDKPWISGSMYSTSKDMAIFMQGMMNKKVLSLNTYEKMFQPQIKIDQPWRHFFGGYEQSHSLGFEVEETPKGRIIHHGGNNGDFQARFAMDWDRKNGFILLTNNNNGFALDLILQEYFFSGRLNNQIPSEN